MISSRHDLDTAQHLRAQANKSTTAFEVFDRNRAKIRVQYIHDPRLQVRDRFLIT